MGLTPVTSPRRAKPPPGASGPLVSPVPDEESRGRTGVARSNAHATLARLEPERFRSNGDDFRSPRGAYAAPAPTRGDDSGVNTGAGALLVFEGLDGSGKTTQCARLAARLRARGRDVVETAEPYDGGTYGPKIRAMSRSATPLAPEEELRWFVEQRREHVRERIGPALAAGKVVLSDRYFLSTAAYQGSRGLDAEAILAANEREFPIPALVLLLEIDTSAALARVASRGGAAEPVFERRDFLERVAASFRRLERPYIARIAADRAAETVAEDVAVVVRARTQLL